MGGDVTEEWAIARAQYLDLVYSQSGTLYNLIPHAPHPTTDPSRPIAQPSADGLVVSVTNQQESKSNGQPDHQTSTKNLAGSNVDTPVVTGKVNSVQSSSPP